MSPAAAASERLPRTETLRKTTEYQSCYRDGGRRQGAYVTVHFRPNGLAHARLGATVARRVGAATVRNRLKRWTRECYRRSPRRAELPPLDVVVHFKPPAKECDFAALKSELERLLASLGGALRTR